MNLFLARKPGLLLVAMGLLAAAWALPPALTLPWLTHAGYWLILFASVIWVWGLGHVLPAAWRAAGWQPADRWCGAVIVLATVTLLAHEAGGFKVPAVEIKLLGVSMAMHWERAVFVPLQGAELNGLFELSAGAPGSPPLFFPFLLSVVHDLTGYRPENAFALNGLLTFFLLGLSYWAGRCLLGWRGGLYAVLAWTAWPLLGQSGRGGGAEILQVLLLVGTALLAGWHYLRRDDWSCIALAYSGVLLAQTRPESPLFLLPVAGMMLVVWWEDRLIQLPWSVALAPLFLLPWAWALHPVSGLNFASGNVPENLGHAFIFWFSAGIEQPNAPLLTAVGLLALILLLFPFRRLLPQWGAQPAPVKSAVLFAGALLLFLAVVLACSLGRFDQPATHRLSFPAHLLTVVAPLLLLRLLPAIRFGLPLALGVAALALVARGLPALGRQSATSLYPPALETAWRREFARPLAEKDYQFIDRDTALWVTHGIAALAPGEVRRSPEVIATSLRDRQFSAIYVFQRGDIDEATGAVTVRSEDDLGPAFELEPMAQKVFRLNVLSRISRVKAVHETVTTVAPKSPPPRSLAEQPNGAAQENSRLADWLKRLP